MPGYLEIKVCARPLGALAVAEWFERNGADWRAQIRDRLSDCVWMARTVADIAAYTTGPCIPVAADEARPEPVQRISILDAFKIEDEPGEAGEFLHCGPRMIRKQFAQACENFVWSYFEPLPLMLEDRKP